MRSSLQVIVLSTCGILLCLLPNVICEAQNKKIDHGTLQLRQVLQDRPEMQNVIADNHAISKRAIELFNNSIQGKRVIWDNTSPLSGQPAEHMPPYSGFAAKIRITPKKEYTGKDKWALLIYELENVRSTKDFKQLFEKATLQKIQKQEFVRSCLQLELDAMKRLQDFFGKHPISDATDESARIYQILMAKPTNTREFIKELEARETPGYDPRLYFGNYFDSLRGK